MSEEVKNHELRLGGFGRLLELIKAKWPEASTIDIQETSEGASLNWMRLKSGHEHLDFYLSHEHRISLSINDKRTFYFVAKDERHLQELIERYDPTKPQLYD